MKLKFILWTAAVGLVVVGYFAAIVWHPAAIFTHFVAVPLLAVTVGGWYRQGRKYLEETRETTVRRLLEIAERKK